MSGVLSCYLIGVSLHLADHTSKVFQVIIQFFYGFLFMGLQRTPLSLHPMIFEKGSMTLLTKVFPTYHPNYLSVLFYGVAENPSFSASYNL
jgi:hypothetical protein